MEILLICVVDAVRWNVVADYCKKEVGERSFGLDLFFVVFDNRYFKKCLNRNERESLIKGKSCLIFRNKDRYKNIEYISLNYSPQN